MRQKKRLNDSGVVLIAVVAFVIVMSVLVLGMLSRNVSQALSVERQVQHIQGEQLRQGAFWLARAYMMNGTAVPASLSETVNGKVFTVAITSVASGQPGVSTVTTTVQY